MNFIHKRIEPKEFTEWKKTIGTPGNSGKWDDFQNPEKGVVHQSLLMEQGFVCCYCEQRVSKHDSHIEHIKPQSEYFRDRFTYQNMLASCNGDNSTHCGHRKDRWYNPLLFVSPLDTECTTFFKFTSAGEMIPTDNTAKHQAASETIKRLNLNARSLLDKRKRVLGEFINMEMSTDDIIIIKRMYSHQDISGQFGQFRAFVDYMLGIYITNPTIP